MSIQLKKTKNRNSLQEKFASLGTGAAVMYRHGYFEVISIAPNLQYPVLAANESLASAVRDAVARRGHLEEGTFIGVSGGAVITQDAGPRIGRRSFAVMGKTVDRIIAPVRLTGHVWPTWSRYQHLLIEPVPGIRKLLKWGTRLSYEGWLVTGRHHWGFAAVTKLTIGKTTFEGLKFAE